MQDKLGAILLRSESGLFLSTLRIEYASFGVFQIQSQTECFQARIWQHASQIYRDMQDVAPTLDRGHSFQHQNSSGR